MISHSIFKEQTTLKPDHYPWTDKYIDALQSNPWTHKEFTFAPDYHDFNHKLTELEKGATVRALTAISQIEIAVKTFWAKLGDNLPHPSLRDLGIVLGNNEVVHNRAYAHLLSVLGLEEVFEEDKQSEVMIGRLKYLRKYTHRYYKDSAKQFLYALILFTLFVENASLFSQFYIINWFGRRDLLKHANQQVKYTRNEETIHAMCGMDLVREIRKEQPDLFDDELYDRIHSEVRESFKAESNISKWMLGDLRGDDLSPEILDVLIMGRLNDGLREIGFTPQFEIDEELAEHTLWFEETLLGNKKTDFFSSKPVEYSSNDQSFDDLF